MIITYTQFQPSNTGPFSFGPSLDGDTFNATVTWLLYGARWYLNLFALDGTWIFTEALVASPAGINIQSASWANGRVMLVTVQPHGYKVGRIVSLTVSGMAPDAYNGRYNCLVTGPLTVSYALASNPGPASAFGALSYDINLVGGYFTTSTLVFREGTSMFEVGNPAPATAAGATGGEATGSNIFILGKSILGGPDVLG